MVKPWPFLCAAGGQQCEHLIKRYSSECHDYAEPAKIFQFLNQVIAAIGDLFGIWFVSGWGTMDDSRNVTVDEPQSVVSIKGNGLTRKPEFVQ